MFTAKRIRAFWASVDRAPEGSDCWLWTKSTRRSGYGQFGVGGIKLGVRRRNLPAQRVAWILTNGDIPAGLFVLHRCDTPRCVRPDHLFLGTPKDNTQDMMTKGRATPPPFQPGTRNPLARLSAADVQAIRGATGISIRSLAQQYGVDWHTLARAKRGESYRDVA